MMVVSKLNAASVRCVGVTAILDHRRTDGNGDRRRSGSVDIEGVDNRHLSSVFDSAAAAISFLRFPAEVITVAGALVCALRPVYGDVEESPAQRAVEVDHVTVYPVRAAVYAPAGGCGPSRPGTRLGEGGC